MGHFNKQLEGIIGFLAANVAGDYGCPRDDISGGEIVEEPESEGEVMGELEVEGEEAVSDEAIGVEAELQDMRMEGEAMREGR